MKKKTKKFTDEAGGKGTVKRPVNPSESFRKGKKKATDKQSVAEGRVNQGRDLENKKKKKKMSVAQDDAMDRRMGIKSGSKRDQAMDRRNGVVDKKKSKKAVKRQVIAHKSAKQTAKQAWMDKVMPSKKKGSK